MTKYKNKQGIELNFSGDDMQSKLVKEVVEEAINIFQGYNRFDARSAEWALSRGVNFLKENFDIEEDYPYNVEFGDGRTKEEMQAIDNQCRIRAYNRNRSVEDQVSTVEEIEEEVRKWVNEIPNS